MQFSSNISLLNKVEREHSHWGNNFFGSLNMKGIGKGSLWALSLLRYSHWTCDRCYLSKEKTLSFQTKYILVAVTVTFALLPLHIFYVIRNFSTKKSAEIKSQQTPTGSTGFFPNFLTNLPLWESMGTWIMMPRWRIIWKRPRIK